MRKLLKRQSAKTGLPPGALVHVGDEPAAQTRISVVRYDEHDVQEEELPTDAGCPPIETGPGVNWVLVSGLGQVEVLEGLGERFGLHPLVLEDILNTGQRPKLEEYAEHIYIVAKLVRWNEDAAGLQVEQISVILGPNYVITFQESEAEVFGALRERIRLSGGRMRALGPDYLAYAVLDLIVDTYFVVLEHVGEEIDSLEGTLADEATPRSLQRIYEVKRELVVLRRAAWPLREAVGQLYRDDTPLVTDTVRVYLRDAYDHTVQVIETAEAIRDVVGGLVDLHMSTVSNRMNSVMHVLTIIATLFIPLTFIAGVYGMNFQHMPELALRWGYPAVLGVMLAVAVAMLWYFRRRRWL